MTPLLLVSLLAVPPDTLVVGILTDPVTLEPHRATDLVSTAVVANVCETLVHFRSGGTRPEGVLATTWATVDRRVWTFTLRELHGRPEITLDSQTGLNLAFLSINNDRPPFGDRRVRQALARAIDRDRLVRHLLGGHGKPAQNPLPPALWGYDSRTRDLVLDRSAARRLLAQAGFPEGFETTLMAVDAPRPYMPHPLRLAAEIRDDLREVGVRAVVREVPTWAEYVGRATRGDYDLALLGWQADTLDPNDFLSVLLDSGSIGTTNRSRYRNPAMDALLKRARMGSDLETRLAAYREVQALFQKDLPWVPLYHGSVFTAYRRVVRGLSIGPTGVLRYDKTWKLP